MPEITGGEAAAIDRLLDTWYSLSPTQKGRVPTALAREVADVAHFRRKAQPGTTTWGKLQVNDWIVCPVSGLPEQVTISRPGANGRRFVRTTSHDHNRQPGESVERANRPSTWRNK